MKRPSTDPAVRDRALRMVEHGVVTMTDIATMLHISVDTIRKWRNESQPKPVKVITPAPYARGYRFFNTKW